MELLAHWQEEEWLFLLSITASPSTSMFLWSELDESEAYWVGRGAVGLPLSSLDGEDIFSPRISATRCFHGAHATSLVEELGAAPHIKPHRIAFLQSVNNS